MLKEKKKDFRLMHPTIKCSVSKCNCQIKQNVIDRFIVQNPDTKVHSVRFTCFLHGLLERGKEFLRTRTIKGENGAPNRGHYEEVRKILKDRERKESQQHKDN